jgi:TIR domain
MTSLFVSHAWADLDLARALQARLAVQGYRIRIPAGTAVAGNWRAKYAQALASADVMVVLVTEAALASPNVLGEIGAARVLEPLRGVILLPVLVGDIPIPPFISDIYCFRLNDQSNPNDLDVLSKDLCKAIDDNIKLVPRIFISHRHKDEPVVSALTALLEQAFFLESADIRCTSVQPYMLTPGERTSELLRKEIAGAELVIGVLSPDTTESNYVLCELGASWGRDVATFPVLIRGATFADVPAPLSERHSISLEKEENCLQLIDYVASRTSLTRREGTIGKVAQQARLLAAAAKVQG